MSEKKLRSLVVRGDAKAFHSYCRELLDEEVELSLSGATFEEIEITGYDFSDIDLSNTEWQRCSLSSCKFDRADLSGAYFVDCGLIEVTGEETNLEGTAFDGGLMKKCRFEECNMSEMEIENTQLDGTDVEACEMSGVQWTGVSFTGGALRRIAEAGEGSWDHVKFRDATIADSDLSGVESRASHWRECTFERAQLPDGFDERKGRRRAV